MAFTWMNKQGVRSSDGFDFQFTGRFSAEYRESGRVIRLDVESGAGVVAIREHALQGMSSNANDPIVVAGRERIATNIRAALEFMGLSLELV